MSVEGCTYRPDCPWYYNSVCNSPNDHRYHECDYDRGIFPESYEEGRTMKDLIEREAALACFHAWVDKHGDVCTPDDMMEYQAIEALPSAEPSLVYCKDCIKRNKCNFYQTQGDNGYCRYGRSEDGRLNPQK